MSEDLDPRIAKSIEDVERFKKTVTEVLTDMSKKPGVEETDAKRTAEDDPLSKLFDIISENIIDTLKIDAVSNALNTIEEDTSEDSAKALVELLTVAMSFSAFNAISAYDVYLGEILTVAFENVSNRMSRIEADISGMVMAIQELNKRIDELKKRVEGDQ